jgi:carbamoyltransferase
VNVLGLNFVGIDPSACVVSEGQIRAFCEEERLVRLKKADNIHPSESARVCLDIAGLKPGDIDVIVFPWDVQRYSNGSIESFYRNLNRLTPPDREMKFWQADSLRQYNQQRIERDIEAIWRDVGGGVVPPIRYVAHHHAHACGVFRCSGFADALVLVVDGNGEEFATSLWVGKGHSVERIHAITIPHSLGWFYSTMTSFLGFTPGEDEYKVMGLASYGRAQNDLLSRMRRVLAQSESGDYRLQSIMTYSGSHSYSPEYTDALVDLLEVPPRSPNSKIEPYHEDLAYATQVLLEETLLGLLQRWRKETGLATLCMNGGVALNCKANGRILQSGLFDKVFALPMAGDAGQSLGAALVIAGEEVKVSKAHIFTTHLGPQFTSAQIQETLIDCGVCFEKVDDVCMRAARAIAFGKIVGWFQGRMEGGPRALGGRSILADPRYEAIRDRVNRAVKFREIWRPFCPSIMWEEAEDYIPGAQAVPLMTHVLPVTDKARKTIPAVVHVDGTSRPHVVHPHIQPLFWRVLRDFRELTGVPAVLNTSFNVRGEPIVATPRDAIRCFFGSGLDALAMGDYWIEKCQGQTAARPMWLEADSAPPAIRRINVPAGDYLLGPSRMKVWVDAFAIGTYPVTNREYGCFLEIVLRNGDGAYRHPLQPTGKPHQPQYWLTDPWNRPDHPVVGVDWWDAWAFCRWAGGFLPSECQWEAAATGLEGRRYPWGDSWEEGRANTRELWGQDAWKVGRTTPVDTYPQGRTEAGVYDLTGNVWEFTADAFATPWTPTPRLFDGGGTVTIKGGSFRRTKKDQTCRARDESEVDCRGQNNGFRCAFRAGNRR